MTDADAKQRPRRLWEFVLVVAVLGLAISGGLAWYATTPSFQAMVRGRLIRELEGITGGRVEVGSVHTVPFQFQVEVRDLTIHGLERREDIPYAHVDRLVARLKLSTVLSFGLSFRSVVVEHPIIHIISYPDGTTNQPVPRIAQLGTRTPVEILFAVSINELEVRAGDLLWNNQKIPLDFSANNVFADMNYSLLHSRYEGNLLLGKALTHYQALLPIAWTAAAHYRLSESGLEIMSLQITSGRSRFKASGTLANFAKPKFTGNYELVLDVGEASSTAHMSEFGGGILEAAGKGTWTAEDFSSSGKLQARDLSWRNAILNFRGANFNTGFSFDSKHLSFPDITGKFLGGTVEGTAEIAEWLALPNAAKTSKAGKPQEAGSFAHLKFKNISASEVASAISTSKRPFIKMNIAGLLAGSLDARWKGSPNNLVADTLVDVTEPAALKPGQLAVQGHARTTYRRASEELEVGEFSASTKATQIRASGTLSNSSTVRLSVSTSNLGEWQPILIAAGYVQAVPVKLLGPASFNGTATGRLSSITFAGKLESGNFDFVVPATSRTAEEDVHWDSFITDLRISPAGLALRNSVLRRNTTAIDFDLNLGLLDREFTPASPFTARVNMQRANLAELLPMAGYDYPASGIMDLSVQLAGTRSDPEGSGTVHISKAMIHGQPIQQLSSTLNFTKGDVAFHDIEFSQSAASISGDASYTFASHAFTLNLSGSHFDLSHIPPLQASRVLVQGRLDFTVHGTGTVQNPILNAQLHLRDLTLDQELAGDFIIEASSLGSELAVSGTSQFKGGDLTLKGTVHPSGNWPADLNLHFAHLDIDSILKSYFHGHVTGHSAVVGDLHLQGSLRRPSELNLAGDLSDGFADIENVKVHNDGHIRFAISNHSFKVEHFHLLGDGTDISGDGSVQLAGERQIDFKIRGQLNLQLTQSYNPDFTTTGTMTVDMAIGGTAANPLVQGRMQIANGSIAYVDFPSGLSGVNGSMTFNQNQFDIENLSGHVGGGSVTFRGHASLRNGKIEFDLGWRGEAVRLRYPPGVSSTADLDLRFAGDSTASTVTGDITVTKLAVTPGFDFGSYLQRNAQSAAISQTNPVLNRIRLDVHITTIPDLQMQTAVIRLSGDADLRLRGTAAKSVLLGRADVLEGQAYLNGTKYRLERGDVTFTNPVITMPVVDLQASTHVRDYDITLNLNGPADKLNLTYRSEPPLPTMDIIALLAFGQTTQQSTQLQQNGASSFNQDASNAILAAALNATVSNRAQRLFGVSRIKINPQGLNTETSPTQSGPAITIEQQVASNITVSYSTNVSQTSQQVIQAEYNVTRNISIVAIRDENGVVSFDVRIRQRKR